MKTILVTGAGGTLGTAVCQHIARTGDQRLIAWGRGEGSIYTVLETLGEQAPDQAITPVIGDVGDERLLAHVLDTWTPEVIIHTAAHKHVSFMEQNPAAAILNNVGVTDQLVRSAKARGVRQLVLCSTDKAVAPTSVMGATKRVAEAIVARAGYTSVRLVNIWGASGSVIPRWQRQVIRGGPLTMSDPRMERMFMTSDTAAHLLVEATGFEFKGRVCVPPPTAYKTWRLDDLARWVMEDMCRDAPIHITGALEGEKQREVLLEGDETASKRGPLRTFKPVLGDAETFVQRLAALYVAAGEPGANAAGRRALAALVPTATLCAT